MPGVNYPNNERLPQIIADLANRVRALETQQQISWSNALGQILITMGLVPGSNPAEYGFQLLNPATGAQIAFLGEDSSGNAVFTVTGTETVSGTLNVTGSQSVGGSLNVTGPATFGNTLSVTGSETVSGTLDVTGNMIVGGTLSLPNGIINNAALANPISFGSNDTSASGLNLPSTQAVLQSAPITVPSGFTQCAVIVVAEVGCTATATAASGIQAQAYASTVTGDVIAGGPLAGQSMTVPASLATTLTGLSGYFTVGVKGNYYGSAPAANSGNAHVGGLAIFSR